MTVMIKKNRKCKEEELDGCKEVEQASSGLEHYEGLAAVIHEDCCTGFTKHRSDGSRLAVSKLGLVVCTV